MTHLRDRRVCWAARTSTDSCMSFRLSSLSAKCLRAAAPPPRKQQQQARPHRLTHTHLDTHHTQAQPHTHRAAASGGGRAWCWPERRLRPQPPSHHPHRRALRSISDPAHEGGRFYATHTHLSHDHHAAAPAPAPAAGAACRGGPGCAPAGGGRAGHDDGVGLHPAFRLDAGRRRRQRGAG